MVTLLEMLREKHPGADERVILRYLEKGFVKREGEVITNPHFPVKDPSLFVLENEDLLDKSFDYWVMMEIDERWLNLQPTSRVLGLDMKPGYVEYILDRRAEVVVLNFRAEEIPDFVEVCVGNLFIEDFSKKLTGIFDWILSFLSSNPLRLMGVVERYLPKLSGLGAVALCVDAADEEQTEIRDSYEAVASAMGLSLRSAASLNIDRGKICLLLKR